MTLHARNSLDTLIGSDMQHVNATSGAAADPLSQLHPGSGRAILVPQSGTVPDGPQCTAPEQSLALARADR
jgi:hypothetical protein